MTDDARAVEHLPWHFESRTMRADLTGDLSQHLLG